MTPGEIVVATVVALCFVAALVYRIYLTVRKKGGCDDCGGDCAHCGACRHAAALKKKKTVECKEVKAETELIEK